MKVTDVFIYFGHILLLTGIYFRQNLRLSLFAGLLRLIYCSDVQALGGDVCL